MNLKRFTARTSREALAMVKQTFGEDAVVMSTRPCAEGVEVVAMAPESVMQLERIDAPAAGHTAAPAAPAKALVPARVRAAQAGSARETRIEPMLDSSSVDEDVERMAMSTLSFQDYVRERMLKRRQAELVAAHEQPARAPTAQVSPLRQRLASGAAGRVETSQASAQPTPSLASPPPVRHEAGREERVRPEPARQDVQRHETVRHEPPVLREEVRERPTPARAAPPAAAPLLSPSLADGGPRRDQAEMMNELRSMRGLIEQRFGALAFMEKLQRQPRHATLAQKLLECGFSPSLIRRLVESLPSEGEEMEWAAGVLERNLVTGDSLPALEEQGGVFALIGSTGVGKTTTTAKIAAAFAAQHGAANLGLITLDAYRVGAHEQLRTYGRILGVPVHTAHDRASLEDLLELLSAKKMVLIDTAGMAQRDVRTRELLEMLSHASVKRLLVMNAAAQGETFEDVIGAYGAASCAGVILSKIDEAVKLGPALDVLIRHRLKVLGVANGQRVPEDWHRLSASALVQRALRNTASAAWRFDAGDVNLVFAGTPQMPRQAAAPARA